MVLAHHMVERLGTCMSMYDHLLATKTFFHTFPNLLSLMVASTTAQTLFRFLVI